MRKLSAAMLATLLLIPPAGSSEGLSIQPGLWEMHSEMTMSFMPQPMVKTKHECMSKSELSAEDLTAESDCTLQDYEVSGDTMNFTMLCPGPEGASTATGTYVSEGDSGHGEMHMTMVMNGAEQTMKMAFKGRRVGEC